MKLYTKEMFLIASEKCEVSMIDAEHIVKYIDEYVTPIELPSDEEIEEVAKDYADTIGNKNGTAIFDYIKGAKWMREQILKQQS